MSKINKTIALCGSTLFYEQMDNIQQNLESIGFNVIHPRNSAANYSNSIGDLHKYESHKSDMSQKGRKYKQKLIVSHLEAIRESDGVLIVNLDKNGKKNYIGGNTFLEMGFALAFGKKIYVLNELPKYSDYYDELTGMLPVVIKHDLSKILE